MHDGDPAGARWDRVRRARAIAAVGGRERRPRRPLLALVVVVDRLGAGRDAGRLVVLLMLRARPLQRRHPRRCSALRRRCSHEPARARGVGRALDDHRCWPSCSPLDVARASSLSRAVGDRLRDVLPRVVAATIVLRRSASRVAMLLGAVARRALRGRRLAAAAGCAARSSPSCSPRFAVLLALEQLGLAAQFIMALGLTAVAAVGARGRRSRSASAAATWRATSWSSTCARSTRKGRRRAVTVMSDRRPFELLGVVHLVRPAGRSPRDLEELRLGIAEARPTASLFYHTSSATAPASRPRGAAARRLERLGERRGAGPRDRRAPVVRRAGHGGSPDELRAALLEVLDAHPREDPAPSATRREDGDFVFLELETVRVPTGCVVGEDAGELIGRARRRADPSVLVLPPDRAAVVRRPTRRRWCDWLRERRRALAGRRCSRSARARAGRSTRMRRQPRCAAGGAAARPQRVADAAALPRTSAVKRAARAVAGSCAGSPRRRSARMTLVAVPDDGPSLLDGYRARCGDGPMRVARGAGARLRGPPHRDGQLDRRPAAAWPRSSTGWCACSNELGVPTTWEVMPGDTRFYGITKTIHNTLHGWPGTLERRRIASTSTRSTAAPRARSRWTATSS